MECLSEFIKKKRNEQGLSKRKLAEAAGISHTEIYRLENGERKSPSPMVLVSIAKVLSINPVEILVAAKYLDDNCIDKDSLCLIDLYKCLSTEEKQDVLRYIDFIKSKH